MVARCRARPGASLPLSAVDARRADSRPRRNIFCSGVNYRAHAAEWAASGIDAGRVPQRRRAAARKIHRIR